MRTAPRRLIAVLAATAVTGTLAGAPGGAHAADQSAPPVRLVVGYRSGVDVHAAAQSFTALGAQSAGTATDALDALHATAIQVAAARSASVMAALRSDPNVAYVEVDHVRKVAETTPDDPFYTENLQPELQQINVPNAWQTTTGSAVTIAVVDTGVTVKGDLIGQVLGGFNFVAGNAATADDFGHGTTVASLIAAKSNNGEGMAGVCWQCRILPVKVLDKKGNGYDSTIAKGVIWAVQHGAKVVNMSLGGSATSTVLSDAIAYANLNGVLVVAAAGNENSSTRSYPAAYADVLAVGATNRCPNFGTDPTCTTGTNDRAPFSNYNSASLKWVDVAAPGIVTGMDVDGNYNTGEAGTSFSAPLVSGVAGLIKSYHPGWTGWSLMAAIQTGAGAHKLSWVTYGKVDADNSLRWVTDAAAPTATGITPGQNAKLRGTITITPQKVADPWSGIRNVSLWVGGKYVTYTRTAPYSIRWNSAGRNGPVAIQLRIYDKAGNLRTLNRTIIADNTAPAVKITKAPKNKAKINGTVKVSYSGSDKYGVKRYVLIINGKVVQTHTTTKSAFSFKASKYPKKNIKVYVRAYDVAGNYRNTATRVYHR